MNNHGDIASIKIFIRQIETIKKYVNCVLVEGFPHHWTSRQIVVGYRDLLKEHNKDLQLPEQLEPFKAVLTPNEYTLLQEARMPFRDIFALRGKISQKEKTPEEVRPYICIYVWYAFVEAADQAGLPLHGLKSENYHPGFGMLMPERDSSIVEHCRAHVKEKGSCFALVGAAHGVDMIEAFKSDMEIQDSYFHIYSNNILATPDLPSMQFKVKLASHPEYLGKKQLYEFLDYIGQNKLEQDEHFQKTFDKAHRKAAISSLQTHTARRGLRFFIKESQQLIVSLEESYKLSM